MSARALVNLVIGCLWAVGVALMLVGGSVLLGRWVGLGVELTGLGFVCTAIILMLERT